MRLKRVYEDWDESDPLDPETAAMLDYLDRLAQSAEFEDAGETVVTIDGYGVARVAIPVGPAAELWLQSGDGWDRVIWTCPSGNAYEWTWRHDSSPGEIDRLVAGQGAERTYMFRRRVVGRRLELLEPDPRPLAGAGLRLRLALHPGLLLVWWDQPAR